MTLQPFKGTARFEARRRIGSGTAGVVYEVWDRERGCAVALKLLHQGDAASLYRFKQEFRALAHLSHPNLIQLHELQHVDGQWFFTMELVDGVDFIRHVREPRALERGVAEVEARLRPAARQLARGLRALHASGRLHRDIKPSNVLVDGAGKVVLLDFGLVTKATEQQTFQSFTEDILGTPAYMAPEQGAGRDLTEATDWYGVGALVYESLTGEPPFAGQFVQVMLEKQRSEPRPPRQLVPGISRDLDELCQDLLRREAELRPQGDEVLERLGVAADETERRASRKRGPMVLVGREDHLGRLWRAFARVAGGEPAVVWVHGASGLGKSALVHRFLFEVRQRQADAVTLAGRCYEHESVSYKALDSLIDVLTRYLRSLPDEEVTPLLPRDVLALARLFPVLRRVRPLAAAERRVLGIPDSLELRRLAFAALRELLMRLAEDHPLVLFIDDLQWGDHDSAGLVAEVMREPDPPPLLLIGAYRDEDAAASPLLRELLPGSGSSLHSLPGEDLEVGELDPQAAAELAAALLSAEAESPAAAQMARQIAREAHGNPLFVEELARHALAHGRVARGGLDEVFRTRFAALSAAGRQLLEVLAVAGGPIEIEVARRASRLPAGEHSAFTVLRVGNLARSTGARGRDRIEIFNDRVAKAVLASVDPARYRVHHQRLARELDSSGRGDPETLAHHFAAAGEHPRALEYAAEAAAAAERALAFNRAARLYRLALDLEPGSAERERALRLRLADALVAAGRSAEAADIYERLAVGASKAEALDMRRRAAERWLVSGHIEKGLATLSSVLGSIGWKLAESPRKALPGLLLRRALLRLRGYRFRERDSTQVSAEELSRVDICWSASIGLGVVDTIRGAAFQARHMELALAAGEPFRVARALAMEVGYTAAGGCRRADRTRELVRSAAELARRVGDSYAIGLATFSSGLAAYLEGRWKAARERFEEAETILRERCTAVSWEIDNIHFYNLITLAHLGRIGELLRRLPRELKEVRERGDLYALTNIRTRVAWQADLAEDEPERARTRLAAAMVAWSQRGFHLQHLWSLWGRVEAALYSGETREPWEQVTASWGAIRRSLLLRIQTVYVDCHDLRARAALAAASASREPERAKLVRAAERAARRIERQGAPWSDPLAELLFAGVAAARGRPEEALDRAAAAEQGFERADMALHAAVARFRRGELAGGEGGDELRAAASAWMRREGLSNPQRIAAQMAPRLAPETIPS